jgi:hypothetical protein
MIPCKFAYGVLGVVAALSLAAEGTAMVGAQGVGPSQADAKATQMAAVADGGTSCSLGFTRAQAINLLQSGGGEYRFKTYKTANGPIAEGEGRGIFVKATLWGPPGQINTIEMTTPYDPDNKTLTIISRMAIPDMITDMNRYLVVVYRDWPEAGDWLAKAVAEVKEEFGKSRAYASRTITRNGITLWVGAAAVTDPPSITVNLRPCDH